MVALVGAGGRFHVAQQGIHLLEAQPLIGAHCGMASHSCQQRITSLGQQPACAVLVQFGEHFACKADRIAFGEHRGHGAHRERVRGDLVDIESEGQQLIAFEFGGIDLGVVSAKVGGDQKRLRGDGLCVEPVFQPLIDDALMRGMHVDHHQTGGVLREHIDAMQLRDGIAQRRQV